VGGGVHGLVFSDSIMLYALRFGRFGNVTFSLQPLPTPSSVSRSRRLLTPAGTVAAGLSIGFVRAERSVGFMQALSYPRMVTSMHAPRAFPILF